MERGKLDGAQPIALEELISQHIERVLAAYDGNVSAAARALRVHRRTLQRKLAKGKRGGTAAGGADPA